MTAIIPFPSAHQQTTEQDESRCDAAHGSAAALGATISARAWLRILDLLNRGCPPAKAAALACGIDHSCWPQQRLRLVG